MRLRIEPANAHSESYSGETRLAPACAGPSRVLHVGVERQLLPRWCWAAIAASLGRFFGAARTQREVATSLLGFDCGAIDVDPALAARANQEARLDEALRLVGCFGHWSAGRPGFQRLRAEIDGGRPVCLRFQRRGGDSHYAVVHGYQADREELHVDDPQDGPSIQPLSRFPLDYHASGGVWRETLWTLPPTGHRQSFANEGAMHNE